MTERSEAHRERQVEVWDLPVRIFHWALALLLVSQVVTASIGGNAMEYHVLGGYAVLALVLFRIVWGLVGSRHARFADFVRGPRAVLTYARSLVRDASERHLGHNPLGGWSVLLMLISLLVQTGTGLFADDEIMTTGPLAKHVSGDTVSLLTMIHDVNAAVLAALVCIHVAAVLYYLVGKRENLIAPMITGRKAWQGDPPANSSGRGRLARAILILAASGLAVAGLVNL
jgi:cytochrome b